MNLIILGMPGSGKGTQATRIAKEYRIPAISTGEMFRALSREGDSFGKKIQEHMNRGMLVPDDYTNQMVEERLQEEDTQNGFILDGYPRTVLQAEVLERYLQRQIRHLDAVLFLGVSRETLWRRLLKRQAAFLLGEGDPHPRMDDQPEIIKERFRVNESLTQALIDFYQERNLLSIIDGEANADVVFERIREALSPKVD